MVAAVDIDSARSLLLCANSSDISTSRESTPASVSSHIQPVPYPFPTSPATRADTTYWKSSERYDFLEDDLIQGGPYALLGDTCLPEDGLLRAPESLLSSRAVGRQIVPEDLLRCWNKPGLRSLRLEWVEGSEWPRYLPWQPIAFMYSAD